MVAKIVRAPLDIWTICGRMAHRCDFYMKQIKARKQWKKPQVKVVQLCCECTAYVDAE
jgi:hypothetical protein